MGNNRFKLSDMIPNAWFYKLRDMSRSRKRNNGNHVMKNKKVASPTTSQRSHQTHSHYFSIEPNIAGKYYNSPIYTKHTNIVFSDSPRRSSKRRAKRKTIYKPSPTTIVSSPVLESWSKPHHADASSIESSSESNFQECVSSDSECDNKFVAPDELVKNGVSSECSCRVSSSTNDIIIDMNNESFSGKTENLGGFDTVSQLGLARILTKPVKFDDKLIEANESRNSTKLTKLDEIHDHHSLPFKIGKEERIRTRRERKTSPTARKSSANSTGIKLRVNSPKLSSRKVQAYARRSSVSTSACKASKSAGFQEGLAVVKSSVNPQKDFRESMVEMIKENNIRASKDLENLLACYLSLNSSEYHDLIVKAFEQIWYDMAQLRL